MKKLKCLLGFHDKRWRTPINWKHGEFWECRNCPKVGR